jgi:Polyketide cyclase / dehydrase and lipid transport
MRKLSKIVVTSAAALLLTGLSASALESRYKASSTQSVAEVWNKVGDFCGIANWHPAVEKCDLSSDGKERTLSLKGGGTIVEDLVNWKAKGHSYTYTIKSSPLPVADYVSTLKVEPHGSGSLIVWSGHYKAKGAPPAKAKEAIDGVYKAGVDSLAK